MTIPNTAPAVAPETTSPPGQGDAEAASEATPTTMKHRKKKIAAVVVLLLIVAALFGWYWFNRKPFTELPGLSVAKVPHYQFSIYGTTKPLGVAVTPSGDRIYVTEAAGDRLVRAYDNEGKPAGILKPPASTGAAHTPVYVAINPATNDVYVSDRLTSSVYIYDEKGTYLRTFAPRGDLGGGWAPLGLAFDAKGSLYATDVSGKSHRVLVFAPDGTLVRSMSAPGPTLLTFPNGLVVDRYGNVQVADSNNGRLVVFDPAGKMLAAINRGVGEGDLGLPRGVAVDDKSRLLVADTVDHMVRVYDVGDSKVATPKYIGSFGAMGQSDGTFQYPNGVATDTHARVYVTDRDNDRVQVWGY
jgi:DNA-binding beta-propeller fold protein YncE